MKLFRVTVQLEPALGLAVAYDGPPHEVSILLLCIVIRLGVGR